MEKEMEGRKGGRREGSFREVVNEINYLRKCYTSGLTRAPKIETNMNGHLFLLVPNMHAFC